MVVQSALEACFDRESPRYQHAFTKGVSCKMLKTGMDFGRDAIAHAI